MSDPTPTPAAGTPRGSLDLHRLHPETRAIRAGRDDAAGALAPVVWGTSTFEGTSPAELEAWSTRPRAQRFYTRHGNPSVAAFEQTVAALEGGGSALAFASGMGAVAGVVLGLCSAGDHIVAQRQLYAGTYLFLAGACARFGIDVTFVDASVPGAFAEAVRPGKTMLVWAESPSNPTLTLADLGELASIRGPWRVVDATFATPLGQRTLERGADLVVHSATKGLGGHNDATLGVVAGDAELLDAVWSFAVLAGATPSPWDASAALRGLRTLAVRLERQSATALVLAQAAEGHPALSSVTYPGLASYPQRDLAERQLTGHGSMVALDFAGGAEAAGRFLTNLRLVRLASSLGGPETLASHAATSTHVGLSPAERRAAGIGDGLVRLSVGLEHPDDLRADLLAALDAAVEP